MMTAAERLESYIAWQNFVPCILLAVMDDLWGGTVVEDAAHWNEMGIHTPEQFERYMLESYIYDTYKDVNGIRPRWIQFDQMSIDELQKMADDLACEIDYECNKMERRNQEAKEAKESEVKAMCESYEVDRETAERWIEQAKAA